MKICKESFIKGVQVGAMSMAEALKNNQEFTPKIFEQYLEANIIKLEIFFSVDEFKSMAN